MILNVVLVDVTTIHVWIRYQLVRGMFQTIMIAILILIIVNGMVIVNKELQELFAATPTKKRVDRRYLFVRIQIQTIVITLHVELLINAKVSHIAIGVYADMIHL